MIVEQALLRVRAGEDVDFRAAMALAMPLIAASPGFVGNSRRPSGWISPFDPL